ncbi:hypothetical protein E2C01_059054 [Portunus trituberculatus]|uniref:Uncharacterized protein n=1 Tax=Portunus trituberculatus TaxID=210409 RepID=A0A5B7H1H9_PORTR|nr:hypothetical protein [Portunus trituberculatus]
MMGVVECPSTTASKLPFTSHFLPPPPSCPTPQRLPLGVTLTLAGEGREWGAHDVTQSFTVWLLTQWR